MLNWPKFRCLIRGDLDLQIFVAPFTDSHYTAPDTKDQKQRINQATKFDVESNDQRENKFTAAKMTLISILRSWQGLIYLCEPQSSECNLVSNSCLKSLINMLYLPYNDVRRRLIDLIFELLYIPLPDSIPDFEVGLKFLEKHQLSMDSWKIQQHDAFVVDEAKAILTSIRSRSRMNLVDNYLALLLVALFNCNVVDALSEVIITPSNQENSIRATILLYQLLSLAYQYLPTDSFSQYLTLSTLIRHATSKVDDSRDLANAALINLGRVHPLKKSSNFTNTRCSLFLGQILEFCTVEEQKESISSDTDAICSSSITPYSNSATSTLASRMSSEHKQTTCGMSKTSTLTSLSSNVTDNSSSSSTSTLVESASNAIVRPNTSANSMSRSPSMSSRTSSILAPSVSAATSHIKALFSLTTTTKASVKSIIEQDWSMWDWEQINFMLTRPSESMKKLSSQHYKAFIKRLVHFYKPSSNQYSLIDINYERCRQLCETGCNMIDFLVESPEPKATELLRELLHDISASMHNPESSNAHHNGQSSGTLGSLPGHGLVNKPHHGQYINSGGSMLTQTLPHPEINILSSSKLITTISSTYFLFIGRLSHTVRGYQMLEKSSILKLINNLTRASMPNTSPGEVYVKLVISCFDYTKEFNGSRNLLEKFLFHHPDETIRLFATSFLRVLLRANVPDFSKWAIELLVRQLDGPSRIVHNTAADILDEACDHDDNLEGLINIKQIKGIENGSRSVIDLLRSSSDAGIVLLCRYASSPTRLRYLLETPRRHLSSPLDSVLCPKPPTPDGSDDCRKNERKDDDISDDDQDYKSSGVSPAIQVAVDNKEPPSEGGSERDSPVHRPMEAILKIESEFDVELDRWRRVFNYRYVKLVEDVLNNSLTYHQKSDDGKYGRRVDRINLMNKNSHLPPHFYGQLALHPDGIEIIQSRKLLEPIYEMLRNPPKDLNHSEVSVLRFKSALWVIGNVGTSDSGYQLLDNSRELIKLIVGIAKSASVLSLRGTAFYVLGLLGSTEEGAEEMKEHGWIVQSNKVALPLDLGLILTKPYDTELEAELLQLRSDESSAQTSPERVSNRSCHSLESETYLTNSINNLSGHKDHGNDSGTAVSSPSVGSTATITRKSNAQKVNKDCLANKDVSPILRENYSINQLEQIRKDILKHVTSLSHSVASRPAENSLLNLKSKHALVFQHDLALYTEVCQQLARYNFRLHARRFLQELFLDIT